jgi:hypothetical protein
MIYTPNLIDLRDVWAVTALSDSGDQVLLMIGRDNVLDSIGLTFSELGVTPIITANSETITAKSRDLSTVLSSRRLKIGGIYDRPVMLLTIPDGHHDDPGNC